ncbi:response regulator [Neptunomonas marina]|uniref:Response regulator n=1 Tax=Neptunomonas marina TaxID=1815562 RepID=A0A437Q5T6_9GAMM|nr:response regulator [Neptunomonas marina]RVU29873.1 response regulator [Neptunomonas marina]
MENLKVIVVDDAKFICEHVTKIVNEAFLGAKIQAAYNGKEAVKLMSAETFDIVLCDWEMPEMSGLELLKWTRAQPQYQTTPFLMITSRGERSYVLKAIQAGVNDYLGKPFTADQLVTKVHKLLGQPQQAPDAAKQAKAGRVLAQDKLKATGTQKHVAKPKGMAQLRTGGQVFKCAVKDLSLKDALIVIKNEGNYPSVLESVVVDIEALSGDSVAQMNGFIQSLQAVEPRVDSPFINIVVSFVDDDPDKMAHLSKYIEAVRR